MLSIKAVLGVLMTLALVACTGGQYTALFEEPTRTVKPARGTPAKNARGPARFDSNRDGNVQVAELPPRAQQTWAAADTNGDAVVNREEIEVFRKASRTARFVASDKNGNGALDQSEMEPARWSRVEAADANRDGKVTKDEVDDARRRGLLRRGRGRPRI